MRNIGINCSKLSHDKPEQINIFESVVQKEKNYKFDEAVDTVREKFGFTKMVYASSLMEGGRAIARSSLVGGHLWWSRGYGK
ncbi:hypothetical protein MGH68_18415 [Erysipelothrix sp. D19-032]